MFLPWKLSKYDNLFLFLDTLSAKKLLNSMRNISIQYWRQSKRSLYLWKEKKILNRENMENLSYFWKFWTPCWSIYGLWLTWCMNLFHFQPLGFFFWQNEFSLGVFVQKMIKICKTGCPTFWKIEKWPQKQPHHITFF